MHPSSYKYNAMAFWFDRIDDEVLPEHDIEQMADALDATAQDVVSFYLDRGEVPYLCSAQDHRLLEAAPDLLAALKTWLELETTCDGRRICYCEDPEITKHGKCYACMAVDAIAKAEGRDDA